MVKMIFKKFIYLAFSIIVVMKMPTSAYAQKTGISKNSQVAIVKNVLDDGSNLTDDLHTSSNTTIQNVLVNIEEQSDSTLQITSIIGNSEISVIGVPVAKSANGHAIFYKTTSDNPDFEVVNMGYVDNAETNMFFKNYKDINNKNKILKLYLRDLSSINRDYIILECFDYKVNNFSSIVSLLPQDTVMGAWAAREFVPVNFDCEDIDTYAFNDNIQRTYTVEYNELALPQTHTITLESYCTYSNIRIGQMADIIYRLKVTGKTMTCPKNPSLNSKTESFLHVNTLSLRQTTVPNAAFVSTAIDGSVLNKGGSASLSASIGINMGILGASLSVPVTFSDNSTIDINNTYKGYVNGKNGVYVCSVKTKMQSQYKLTKIGHYFEVRSTIADFGNVSKSNDFHKAAWDIGVINADNLSTQNKTIYHNVSIAIKG